MADYFLIKSKLNDLVLQIDQYNLLKTYLGIQTEQLWIVTGQETRADNQLWKLTPEGKLLSKFYGLTLGIGMENLLDILGQTNPYYDYLKSLGIFYPSLVAISPEINESAQGWVQDGLVIKNSEDDSVLDILGASLSEYAPITLASLTPDTPNQQWECIPVHQSLIEPDPAPEPDSDFSSRGPDSLHKPDSAHGLDPSPNPDSDSSSRELDSLHKPDSSLKPETSHKSSFIVARDTLHSGEALEPGECLISANGVYSFCYQEDASLILYENKETPHMRIVWHSGSHLNPPAFQCRLQQSDGNFVIYNSPGHVTWCTKAFGSKHPPSKLVVQDDGKVVIYDRYNTPYWSSQENMSESAIRT
ncbi:MAG: hypothetical protein AAGD25_08330 [Cyanobacteria bacterium P01_F01_bin.150]